MAPAKPIVNCTLRNTKPNNDEELAKICKWLKDNGLTAHVTLDGKVTLRRKWPSASQPSKKTR